jgi:hypothetical protein
MVRTKFVTMAFLLAGVLLAVGQPARAQPQTFSTSSNQGSGTSKATAVFSVTANNTCGTGHACLQVVMSNTTTAFTSYGNNDILDGLFFDIAGGTSSSLSSAWTAVTPGTLANPGKCTGGPATCTGTNINVGNEWAYGFSSTGYSGTGMTTTAKFGFTSSGFSGLTGWNSGTAATFTGNGTVNAIGSYSGVGVDYGIVGSGYTGGSGTAGKEPFAIGSITFDFQLPTGISSLSISNVVFAYGTAPDGSSRAPEPASVTLFGGGVAALAFLRRRKARAAVQAP